MAAKTVIQWALEIPGSLGPGLEEWCIGALFDSYSEANNAADSLMNCGEDTCRARLPL